MIEIVINNRIQEKTLIMAELNPGEHFISQDDKGRWVENRPLIKRNIVYSAANAVHVLGDNKITIPDDRPVKRITDLKLSYTIVD